MSSISSPVAQAVAGLIGDGRPAFLPSLSQHARLLSIETSLPPGALLVEQFDGSEAMSDLFRFDIDSMRQGGKRHGKRSSNTPFPDVKAREWAPVITSPVGW